MMQVAGSTGIWEILVIALVILWLANAYRKNRILKKMDEEIHKPQQTRKDVPPAPPGVEDVEYEEVE